MWSVEITPGSLRVFPSLKQCLFKLVWVQPLILIFWIIIYIKLRCQIVEGGIFLISTCCGAAFLSLAGPALAVWIKWLMTSDKTTDYLRADFLTQCVQLPRFQLHLKAKDPGYAFVYDYFTPQGSDDDASEFNLVKKDGDNILLWPILKHLGYAPVFNRIGNELKRNGFCFIFHKTKTFEVEQGVPPYSKPADGFLVGDR